MQLEIEQKKLTEALKESGQRFPDLDTQRLQVTFCLAFNVLLCLHHHKLGNVTKTQIENILSTKKTVFTVVDPVGLPSQCLTGQMEIINFSFFFSLSSLFLCTV